MSYWLLILGLPALWLALHSKWSGRLVVGLVSGLKRHAENKALQEWAGNYYQWGNQQIRIIENEGKVWVVDEDLLNAAGMKLDKNLRRKLQISYGGYTLIPRHATTRLYRNSGAGIFKQQAGTQS